MKMMMISDCKIAQVWYDFVLIKLFMQKCSRHYWIIMIHITDCFPMTARLMSQAKDLFFPSFVQLSSFFSCSLCLSPCFSLSLCVSVCPSAVCLFVHMCMQACMYVCMCACVCVCLSVCLFACLSLCAHKHARVLLCLYVCRMFKVC